MMMTQEEKELEKIKRERNRYKLNNQNLINKITKIEIENEYLNKRNKTLETIETYLPHRITQISKVNDNRYSYAMLELQRLLDALEYERNRINYKDGEIDEEYF